MPDLVHDYFERDLSEFEGAQLGRLLEENQAEAIRFLGLARGEYRRAGLAEGGSTPKAWLFALAAGLALALTTLLWWRAKPAAQESRPQVAAAPAQPTAPVMQARATEAPHAALEAASRQTMAPLVAGKYSVPVRTSKACMVTVTLLDAHGADLREIYGRLTPAGQHRVPWDGTLDGSTQAPSGTYAFRIDCSMPKTSVIYRLKK